MNQEEEIEAPPDSQDMEYRKVKDEVPFSSFPLSLSSLICLYIKKSCLFVLKDRDEDGSGNDIESKSTLGGGATVENSKWKRKYEFLFSNQNPNYNKDSNLFVCFCYRSIVTLALTFLTSSQAILIVWSKRAGKYEYSVTTANFMVTI